MAIRTWGGALLVGGLLATTAAAQERATAQNAGTPGADRQAAPAAAGETASDDGTAQTTRAASGPGGPVTEAAATQPAQDDEDAAALLASLDADGDDGGDEASLTRQDPLSLYGYMDAGINRLFIPESLVIGGVVPTRETTFLLGNLNLYLDARPVDGWRGLAEIRFTNLPHGEETSYRIPGIAEYARTDLYTTNVTSPDGRDQVLLGGIIIERAWIEWDAEPLFRVRVGQWLTPFGIWNVDHGTPVLISLLQPDFQITWRFPRWQTGVQVSGETSGGDWVFGYHGTISNGRQAALLDRTDDKALGGRVHATHLGDGVTTKVGLSGYWGQRHDYIKELRGGTFEAMTTVDGREWVLGADLSLDIRRLRVRTEAIVSRIDFEDGKHAPVPFGAPGQTLPNHYYQDAYLTVAYQLPFWHLEPLWYGEVTHRPSSSGDTSFIVGPGLNINFSPSVQLKTIAAMVVLTDLVGEDTSPQQDNQFFTVSSRLVLAF